MRIVEIDDEVFAYLQGKAVAFLEQPNDTLRRVLGIEPALVNPIERPGIGGRLKRQKVDLRSLRDAGLLSEGQQLFLHDYKGRRLDGFVAEVRANNLMWNGRRYSMSRLACELLGQHGYSSDSVRGPAHWFTGEGISMLKLWNRLNEGE